jgi:tRNA pseudouridine55 synthase
MLLAVNKPSGITSYDVIRRVKKLFPKQKIGHSGTLDPLATGLLILGIGQGTKLLTKLQGKDKKYQTTIDFSQATDTRDSEYWDYHERYSCSEQSGQQGIQKKDLFITAPSQVEIEKKLDTLIPEKELPLTPFSAKKKEGKKLYELARQWNPVMEKRIMKVYGAKVDSYQFPLLELSLHVGSGTYIRSIGYRIGQEFWLGGILIALRRTAIGTIDINSLDLQALGDTGLMWVEISGEESCFSD